MGKVNSKDKVKKPSKAGKFFKTIGNILLWGIIILLLSVSVVSTVDKFTNLNALPIHATSITSGSMSYINEVNQDRLQGKGGNIKKGDMVISKNVSKLEQLKVGDVIIFNNNGIFICHRIIEIDLESNTLITQGDANNTNDGVIKFEAVKSKVVTNIKGLGTVFMYLQSYYGLLALCGIIFFTTGGYLVFSLLNEKDKKKKKAEENASAQSDNQKIEKK